MVLVCTSLLVAPRYSLHGQPNHEAFDPGTKTLQFDVEQWIGFKLGKEYVKVVYCNPAYLPYMQSTSCEMLGWMKQKLELR